MRSNIRATTPSQVTASQWSSKDTRYCRGYTASQGHIQGVKNKSIPSPEKR
ncbi:hypothetical protein [Psychrobacter lutiphocae]|uniref:hypothetical protein n=1 Tax=Psychrobacter lutiphocae TaxID=540500 RepID=UPI0012EA7277|nr:hypothetical protein [Psychrobacter lutiphocae]